MNYEKNVWHLKRIFHGERYNNGRVDSSFSAGNKQSTGPNKFLSTNEKSLRATATIPFSVLHFWWRNQVPRRVS